MEKKNDPKSNPIVGDHMNLKQKLLAIRKAMPYFQKDTRGFNYDYVAGCAVLGSFREIADKVGVLLVTKIVNKKLEQTRIMNDKNVEKMGRIIDMDLVFTFMDVDSDEVLDVPFAAYGEQQDCSKAFGSALTYAERYFLLKFFTVPTDKDDPDSKGYSPKDTEQKITYQPDTNPPVQVGTPDKKESPKASIELGDRLSKSHLISLEEKNNWEKKKNIPASCQKGIDYLIEKNHIGEQLEKKFYMQIMASGKDLSKKDAEAKAREKIIKEFTPLWIDEAKEKFKDDLK
jgi:hypothetical protein